MHGNAVCLCAFLWAPSRPAAHPPPPHTHTPRLHPFLPCLFFPRSSFPSKRLHGPTTFGGGGRTKIQPSVSPGPSLAHRPLLGDVRETTKGFGGAPRKEVYAALEGPGPGDYSISKPLGTDTPGFKFRADESDGTTLCVPSGLAPGCGTCWLRVCVCACASVHVWVCMLACFSSRRLVCLCSRQVHGRGGFCKEGHHGACAASWTPARASHGGLHVKVTTVSLDGCMRPCPSCVKGGVQGVVTLCM
jgi:hypothetical protein